MEFLELDPYSFLIIMDGDTVGIVRQYSKAHWIACSPDLHGRQFNADTMERAASNYVRGMSNL